MRTYRRHPTLPWPSPRRMTLHQLQGLPLSPTQPLPITLTPPPTLPGHTSHVSSYIPQPTYLELEIESGPSFGSASHIVRRMCGNAISNFVDSGVISLFVVSLTIGFFLSDSADKFRMRRGQHWASLRRRRKSWVIPPISSVTPGRCISE